MLRRFLSCSSRCTLSIGLAPSIRTESRHWIGQEHRREFLAAWRQFESSRLTDGLLQATRGPVRSRCVAAAVRLDLDPDELEGEMYSVLISRKLGNHRADPCANDDHCVGMFGVYHHAAVAAAAERMAIAKQHALQTSRHEQQGEVLQQHHRHRTLQIKEQARDWKRRTKRRIERAVAGRHARLDREHEAELERFGRNESSRIGKLYNQLAYTDWKEVFRRRNESGERGPSILSRAFTALSDVGHRKATIDARHQTRVAKLYDDAKRMLARREERVDAEAARRLKAARVRYGLALRLFDRLQAESRQRMKAQWKEFNQVRRGVTTSAREAHERTRGLKPAPALVEEARRRFFERAEGDGGGQDDATAVRPKRKRRPRKPRSPRRRL